MLGHEVLLIFFQVTSINMLSFEQADQLVLNHLESGRSLSEFRFSEAPTIKVVFETWSPHVVSFRDQNGTLRCSGPMCELLLTLQASLNVNFELRNGDGFWGTQLQNGSWNGMMGYVYRNEVDIALGPLSISPMRSAVTDFTTEIFLEKVSTMLPRPQPQSNPGGFLTPFQRDIWLWLVISLGLSTIIRILFAKYFDTLPYNCNCSKTVIEVYSVIMAQPMTVATQHNASRVLLATGFLVMIVLAKAYGGSLTSLLAVQNVPLKYNNIREVIADNNVKLYMEGSTTLTTYLQASPRGWYKTLHEATSQRGHFSTASELPEIATNVLPGGHASVLIEQTSMNKIISDHYSKTAECGFYAPNSYMWPSMYGVSVRKGSNFKALLDSRLFSIKESGIYERWALQQMPNYTLCTFMPSQVIVHRAYNVNDLWGVFGVLVLGLALSMIVFFFELLAGRNTKKYN